MTAVACTRPHLPPRVWRSGSGAGLIVGLALGALLIVPSTAQAYEVESGDTLSEIAARNGVSTRALASANGIDDQDIIRSGQQLTIPGATGGSVAGGGQHTVQAGETLSQIAAQHGVSTRSLAAANGITDPDLVRSGSTISLDGAAVAPSSGGSGSSWSSSNAPSSGTARQLISEAAARHGWDPAIPLGLAMQESGWNNSVVSSAGARGIMQVMPATGEWVGRVLLDRPIDLGDPSDNTAAGVAYLDHLYNRFDRDLERTLAAYFEGQGNVQRRGPSEAGLRYAANVIALAERYR
ncbi:lytic transglycosylase [Euzebya tangerina]|uniref:lytic transglycosylase n=1 Tax=Euzebya tangerina TaxID=591198 RepID=UPI000E31B212|nr:lytic transglycosylase domain-containing protein [Euzebya tangerina]